MADTEGTTTSTSTESSDATQAADKAKAVSDGRTFTQADLEKKIGERIAREKAAAAKAVEDARLEAIQQFREEHGFDDDALESWKQRDQAAAQTRALKAAATKAENSFKQLEAKHQKVSATLERALCDNEAVKSLTNHKCVDLESALALLKPRLKMQEVDGEYRAVVVDDRGEPTSDTIDEAAQKLLDRKPNLRAAVGNFSGSGSRVTEGQTSSEKGKEVWRTAEGRKQSLAGMIPKPPPRPPSTLTSR